MGQRAGHEGYVKTNQGVQLGVQHAHTSENNARGKQHLYIIYIFISSSDRREG